MRPSPFSVFFSIPLPIRFVLSLLLSILFYYILPYAGPWYGSAPLTLVYLFILFHCFLLPPSVMEHGECRRTLLGTNYVQTQFRDENINYSHSFMLSREGNAIFTRQWQHKENNNPRGVILFLHGYSASSGQFTHTYGNRMANEGFLFCSFDQYGHGRSDGLYIHIDSFQRFVDDAHQYSVEMRKKYPKLKLYLMSESMGGAVALNLSRQFPKEYDGLILMAPMAKIADHMKPHPIITTAFSFLANIFPTLPIAPVPDINKLAFKRKDVRDTLMELNKNTRYGRKPRLITAYTLLNTSLELEKNLHQISSPFLVLHGEDDKVTDPQISQTLFQRAKSNDKTLKLYEGAWHTIIIGESKDMQERVFRDIIQWVEKRL